MEPASSTLALSLSPVEICVIHPGPTSRWLTVKEKWDGKYAKQKQRVQLLRGKEYLEAQRQGFLGGELQGEMPPPSALAGRPSVMMAMEGDDITTDRKRIWQDGCGGLWEGRQIERLRRERKRLRKNSGLQKYG
jgi:hypothetical protein